MIDYRDDKPFGLGQLIYAGELAGKNQLEISLDSEIDGKGRLIDEEENEYIGEFKDSQKHGRGRTNYKNGEVYEGGRLEAVIYHVTLMYIEYKMSRCHGKGKFTYKSGNVYEGERSQY